jgi:hypothetical protein
MDLQAGMGEPETMNPITRFRTLALTLLLLASPTQADDGKARTAALDAYWATVSKAVREGDFEAYAATCHPEGILVSGNKKSSYPLAKALAKWKQEFVDTAEGKRSADVVFRFSQRFSDETTAHETGIFLYSFKTPGEELKKEYVHFECLLVKKADGWKTLMEYQKSPATEAEWKSLE